MPAAPDPSRSAREAGSLPLGASVPLIVMQRCYDAAVRTTIDLPEDLHRQALSIARDTSRSLSETVAELIRRGLGLGGEPKVSTSPRTGLPVVHLGTTISTDDVRALEDDQ